MGECARIIEKDVKIISTLKRKEKEQENIALAIAEIFANGFEIDWQKIYCEANFIRLPHYQWKKDKYWIEPFNVKRKRLGYVDNRLLGHKLDIGSHVWENSIHTNSTKYLKDHVIQGNVVFPAAGYIEMGFAALDSMIGGGTYHIENLAFKKAMFLSQNTDKKVQFLANDQDASFKIISYNEETSHEEVHCIGTLRTMQNTTIAPRHKYG